MNSKTYFAKTLFDGTHWRTNQILTVQDKTLHSIVAGCPDDADVIFDGTVCPGFIDTQVNGGGGRMFNHVPTIETLQIMLNAHAKYGTTSMLPTVITDDYEVMLGCADAVHSAIKENKFSILGIHFEGPHISEPKRGIHPKQHVRKLGDREMALFLRQDIGKVLVTLAPESTSVEQVQTLVNAGVIVSIGHSNAHFDQATEVLKAGATGFTHLFNAMSGLSAREPGVIGCALMHQDSYAGLIVDHFHVHKQNCLLAIQLKGVDRMMLVTDAMAYCGAESGNFEFNHQKIASDGGCLTTPDGTLAGSSLDMMRAVNNTHIGLGIALDKAISMACTSPANFLGLANKKGYLKPGYDGDFIAFNDKYEVTANVASGELQFIRAQS